MTRVTVFGATGGTGGQVVRQALDAGHRVTAVVRDPARFTLQHPALEVTVADLTTPEPLLSVLKESDVAISGLGPRSRKDADVMSRTVRPILAALADSGGGPRFIAVSAGPVGPVPDDEGWVHRRVLLPFVSTLLRDIYADLAVMEDEIRRSGTEWTVVRPSRLVNKPGTGRYRTVVGGNPPRARSVPRADVAHAMLAMVDDPATFRQPVGIGR